jgi:hypothetical protein
MQTGNTLLGDRDKQVTRGLKGLSHARGQARDRKVIQRAQTVSPLLGNRDTQSI